MSKKIPDGWQYSCKGCYGRDGRHEKSCKFPESPPPVFPSDWDGWQGSDPTNPGHYKNKKIEHWDVVEAWGLDYLLGNCTKYISRYQDKGKPLEDLKKAAVYLNRKIKLMEQAEQALENHDSPPRK